MRPLQTLTLLSTLLCAALPAAHAAKLPHMDGQIHEGVATCAGANCHGANVARADSPVLQNEYYLWTREDRHAQAYKSLLNETSKRIGQRLGLVPQESPRCLSCHSDYVPEAQRGRRFRLSDGVGCEACHGGSGNWLESHVELGATHAQNLEAGLYPVDQPLERAAVCLNCHLGGPDHPIDHEIMGAGHPPLGFELDTFTAIQPAHYALDADYAERKGIPSSLQVWAAGQMAASERFLVELASKRAEDGLFPELVFFDCYACHHRLSAERWDADTAPGLGVGKVRLNGVNLLLVREILEVIDPATAKQWSSSLRALHQASQLSLPRMQSAARDGATLLRAAIDRHGRRAYSNKEAWALLDSLSRTAQRTPDFSLAEQSAMALEAVFLTLDQAGQLSASQSKRIRSALDKSYDYTNADKDYSVSGFSSAMSELRKALP